MKIKFPGAEFKQYQLGNRILKRAVKTTDQSAAVKLPEL